MSTDEKVDAWMPLWIGSYLADTMALSRDSHGGYLLLLFAYWRNKGPLADNDEDLAGIAKATPAEWKKLRPRLAKFFAIEDGLWSHTRADKELVTAGLRKAAAVSKAKAGAAARWSGRGKQASSNTKSNAPSMPEALLKQCPTPSPIPTSLRSEELARKRAQKPEPISPAVLIEAGFDAATAAEFIACKASRKAPLTARAWADHLREAAKAGWSPLAAAEKVMGKTWKGFEAKYVADEPRPVAPAQSFRERDAEAATAEVQRWAPTIAKRAEPITLEMESPHGAAIAIR